MKTIYIEDVDEMMSMAIKMTVMIKFRVIKMLADMTSIMTQALIIMAAFIVFAAGRRSFLMRLNIKIVSTDFRVK